MFRSGFLQLQKKCMVRLIFLIYGFLFIVFQTNLYSQPTRTSIIDSENKEPLSYSLITWDDDKKGLYADKNGEIEFPMDLKDSVTIQALGYESRIISINDLKSKTAIPLKQKAVALNEVSVTAQKYIEKKISLPKTKRKHKSSIGSCSNYSFIIGTSFITPPKSYLKEVAIHFKNKGEGNVKLRLRIFGLNGYGVPDEDLLRENIILPEKKGWVYVDATPFSIYLPKNGFVVAVEFMKDTSNPNRFDDCLNPKQRKVSLISVPVDDKIKCWDKRQNNNWYNFSYGKKQNHQLTPLIKLKVASVKD